MLTQDDVATLTAPFAVNEHEFKQGAVYLTEQAITARLDNVDPGWMFSVTRVDERADKCIIYAALTVGGVTRESNGMDASEYRKNTERLPENEANFREKAALTDALKRCARLFGVGRYMLDVSKNVRDHRTLAAWMAQYFGGGAAPEPNAEDVAPTLQQTANPFGNKAVQEAITAAMKNHQMDSDKGRDFVFANMQQGTVYERFSHMHPTFTPDDVLNALPALAAKFHLTSALQDTADDTGNADGYEQHATDDGEAAPQQAGRPFDAKSPSRGRGTPSASATPSKTSTSPLPASQGRNGGLAASSGGNFGAITTVSPSGSARSQNINAPSQTQGTLSSGEAPSAAPSAWSRRSQS